MEDSRESVKLKGRIRERLLAGSLVVGSVKVDVGLRVSHGDAAAVKGLFDLLDHGVIDRPIVRAIRPT